MSFFRRNRSRIIWISIFIVILGVIGSTSKGRQGISKVENMVGNIFKPVKKIVTNISVGISKRFSKVNELFTTFEENQVLKDRIVELESKNREYENIIGKSDILKGQEEMLKNTSYNLEKAMIIGKESGNWFGRFTIDKGSNDGVKKGDIVVQAVELEKDKVIEGLFGRVIDVGTETSKVVTIVDEINRISFISIRTQDGGVISGNVNDEIDGYLFDENADVVKGDSLYTSGLGGLFKKNLYIGTISEVKDDKETMMKTIKVDPAVDFKKIYSVYIIKD